MTERQQLENAIAVLENQRDALGDEVVEAALAAMRARLAELRARPAGEQRKLVTILFADLAGFTAMSEKMDPEDVHAVLNPYFERWNQHLQENHGVVEKYIGDAVMAVFGLEVARENDPQNALRAALAMQRTLAELNQTFEKAQGLRLTMRVGVHTGRVLVSTLGERQGQDFVVVGNAVNLASRLQSTAPPDSLIISQATYRLVRGIFEVRSLDPIQVKGIREPLQTYLVLREVPRAFRMGQRGLEGIHTPTIGREAELKRLQEALHQVINRREYRLVAVIGEAGVGKSRLIYEFDGWLDRIPEQIRYFKARAGPAMSGQPYALLRDLFSFRFEIHDSDPPGALRDKLEAGVRAALGDKPDWQRRAHYLGRLVGFEFGSSSHLPAGQPDARGFYDQALLYLDEYFQTLAVQNPLAILLEDLHWADESSLDVLDHLESALADHPVLLVCAARPSLFERRPDWSQGKDYLTRIDLAPLSPADSRRLVRELLPDLRPVPKPLQDLLVSRSEGNPFYLEELIKMLIELEVIQDRPDAGQVDLSRLSASQLPPTLVGILQARLDRLAPQERLVLQRASIIGRVFWDEAVAYLAGEGLGAEVASHQDVLAALRQREMVFERRVSTFAGTCEYHFKHPLLRDVAYQSVLKAHRRAYHALAALWLESVTQEAGRAGEYAALIAGHHDSAGQNEPAARWYLRAGQGAAAKYSNAEAVRTLSRALELAPQDAHDLRFRLLLARQGADDLLGDRRAQAGDLQALEALAEILDDDRRRAQVALQRGSFSLYTGDYPAARRALESAVGWIQTGLQPDDEAPSLLVDAHILLGDVARRLGEAETARQELDYALDLARERGYRSGEVNALDRLGSLYWSQSDYANAIAHLQKALPLAQELGERRRERSVLNNLGIIAKERGEYGAALDYYRQSQSIAHEIGDRLGEGTALSNLGEIEQRQGDYARAITYAQVSLAIARQIGDRYGEAISLTNLGEGYAAAGDYAQAGAYARRALEISRATGFRMGEGIILGNLAGITLTRGDPTQAARLAREALKIAEEVGDSTGRATVLQVLGDAQAASGHPSAAGKSYRKALGLWDELESEGGRILALAGLSRLALIREDSERALQLLEPVLDRLEPDTPTDMDTPMQVYLTCYQALEANHDPRAADFLAQAQALLRARAGRISDPEMHKSFLENNPVHRHLANAG
jgi:class 3 adenylate cyclase/tetratricopeptide (TPR) repeat protein